MKQRRIEPVVLAIGLLYPTLLTFLYFVLPDSTESPLPKIVYSVGKTVQFALPIAWVALICRETWMLRRFSWHGVPEAVGFGTTVFLAMLGAYLFWLSGTSLAPGAPADEAIRSKIAGFGLASPIPYLFLGLFYSVIHSGLEEYYWRWFVFGRLSKHLPWFGALLLSGIGFMSHHILLLGTYFGYGHWLTWFGSLGVAVGGAYWCLSYRRFDSIWGAWISHGIIDAAIFTIGFLVVFR